MNYLFMTNEGTNKHPELVLDPFDAKVERNDYEVSNRCCYVAYRAASLINLFFFFYSLLFVIKKDPLGVTRFDCKRARRALVCKRFRKPAQRIR